MNEVLIDIRSRAFSFSAVEMLLHTCVASFVPFIIFIEKSIHRFWIFSNAFISDRVDFVSIIFGSRDKFGGISISEVTFLAEAHAHFIEIISLLV